jgi:hypothetical protein
MTFDAFGQKQSLKEQLVGTWTLLSWEQRKGDGTKVERYGTSPKGIAFFDAGGRYIITVMRADRAKYASSALWQGSQEMALFRRVAMSNVGPACAPERTSPKLFGGGGRSEKRRSQHIPARRRSEIATRLVGV